MTMRKIVLGRPEMDESRRCGDGRGFRSDGGSGMKDPHREIRNEYGGDPVFTRILQSCLEPSARVLIGAVLLAGLAECRAARFGR